MRPPASATRAPATSLRRSSPVFGPVNRSVPTELGSACFGTSTVVFVRRAHAKRPLGKSKRGRFGSICAGHASQSGSRPRSAMKRRSSWRQSVIHATTSRARELPFDRNSVASSAATDQRTLTLMGMFVASVREYPSPLQAIRAFNVLQSSCGTTPKALRPHT